MGRQPICVEFWGYRKCSPGEIVEARDETDAERVLEAYPGCFERVDMSRAPDSSGAEFAPSEKVKKTLKNARDKMLREDDTKEFS
jgi:hypothetical protein